MTIANSMPLSLIISWSLFFNFINTHQRHADRYQGASQAYFFALQVSFVIGCFVGLGLLIYYFMQVSWYWPLVLFLLGTISGVLFGFLEVKIGIVGLSLFSFIGWPASAIWTFLIIKDLAN